MQDRKRPADLEVVDAILDVWGEESFPASDPPSSLPPSVEAALAATRPPRFVLHTSGFLEAGYRRFLERRLREDFGFAGSPVEISVRVREKRKR